MQARASDCPSLEICSAIHSRARHNVTLMSRLIPQGARRILSQVKSRRRWAGSDRHAAQPRLSPYRLSAVLTAAAKVLDGTANDGVVLSYLELATRIPTISGSPSLPTLKRADPDSPETELHV